MDNENNYKTFKEQISELPPQFLMALEDYKEKHFNDTLAYIFLVLGENNDFFSLPEKTQAALMEIFMTLHYWGFYGGVSFTLDPDQEYIPKYTNISEEDIQNAERYTE